MHIRNIHTRHYRSLARAGVTNCGGLNVFIGKNNSGKSNVLSAITLMHSHLGRGALAASWPTDRIRNEFTRKDTSTPLEIGVEFSLPPSTNAELRQNLQVEAPHLENAIDQIASLDSVSFIVSSTGEETDAPFLFLKEVAIGTLDTRGDGLCTAGIPLLKIDAHPAEELFELGEKVRVVERDVKTLRALLSGRDFDYLLDREERHGPFALLARRLEVPLSPSRLDLLERAYRQSENSAEFKQSVGELIDASESESKQLSESEISGSIAAFAGETKAQPAYIARLLKTYGGIQTLHLGERRRPIGAHEAQALLRLKVTRGGPARLASIQGIVESLLGVRVDAFEAEETVSSRRRSRSEAEIDIDEFLAEANGAGIREALRIILDLELQSPQLALIEEPEVHLHPGLEHSVHAYLREKSSDIQLFVTTHSTNFVDSMSFQNIYLVTKDVGGNTTCEGIGEEDASVRVPSELGLRLSTVFMFDRLVFVEGPSDEAVLREMAQKLDVDLAGSNVGFVQMGGARNFTHFAAEGTLDLLSRRRISMRFVLDRDERDDDEIAAMLQKLGQRAQLTLLGCRELENYLLVPSAIAAFIAELYTKRDPPAELPSTPDVAAAIAEEVESLKSEVTRLRLERELLKPVFLQTRLMKGDIQQRLESATNELKQRGDRLEERTSTISQQVDSDWKANGRRLAPGTRVLEQVASRFGVRFSKDRGDSLRLARRLKPDDLDPELVMLVKSIARDTC